MRIISFLPIALVVFLANNFEANAQQSYSITDFNKLITENTSQKRIQQNFNSGEIESLKNLVFELNPMLFFQGIDYKKIGKGNAQLIVVESSNLSQLTTLGNEIQDVKLLLIKHTSNNNSAKLDLNSLEAPSLKYVLIECDFECSIANLQNILENTTNVKVLYKISTEQ